MLACIAHLGVPFGSVINPLVIWSINPTGSFARGHARQAFSYQCLYLPFHVVCTALMLFGPVAPLLICMTVGFLLEIPQLVRGSLGLPPLRLVPFTILGR